MKHLLPILAIILITNVSHAQTPDYKKLWEQVEQFEMDGLPKSALKIVTNISKQATQDNNAPQQIKVMLYKSKFALVLEEEAQLNIIEDFKAEIAKSNFPQKNILENLLANLYWQYFKQNRWKFYNRTKIETTTDDFRTWDLQTLFETIHRHYQNALQNGLLLQLEPLETYDAILETQKDSKIYRPTLYDFLSHNALEFYKTNENSITKPAYKFEIDNPDLLGDSKTFSLLTINSKDTTSLQLHALKIYQNLIKFHLKDTSLFGLTEINIERLKFVKEHATFKNSGTILTETLKAEAQNIKQHEASGLYNFEIASLYFGKSQEYNPQTNETLRWKAKEAYDICNTVISKFPKSRAAEKCAILKQQIGQQTVQITTEAFLPVQQHGRLLVRYKNLDSLNFTVFNISKKEFEKFNKIYRKDEQLAFIKKLEATTQWYSKLRNENDFQSHTTEIVIPKLNNGIYLILTTIKNNEESFAFSNIQVTNLALVEFENRRHKIFQIIDRNNGAPIKNALVELSFKENNSRSTQYENFTTNNNGEIKIVKNKDRYNIAAKVNHGKDVAYFGNFYVNPYYNTPKEKTSYKSFLFTDRSIYRPGQTVYFKGIIIKKDKERSSPVLNETIFTSLYNANGEMISELDFESNEYGSVAGEFILPNTGLNGQYYIEIYATRGTIRDRHYFSVEEYKRPKFETKFDQVTETFKANDTVTVKGSALAYAGSTITNAKVVYRVHRKVQYPRWYFWNCPWFSSEPQEISHGETTTNNKGEYEIKFKALPDQSVDKSSLPIFNYEITANVTDLNGETRSTTTIVKVGYHTLVAALSVDSVLDKTKKDHTLSIDTKNLNGEFVPAKGSVKIYKLKGPETVLRQRPWQAPDYQEISKDTFKKLFPHDAYNNEHKPENWEKGNLVFETEFDTKNSKEIKLGKLKKWVSGKYIITLKSNDRFGQEVKDEIKTTLYANTDETLADQQLFSITTDKSNYKVGDTAIITLASAADNLIVTVNVEKDRKTVKTDIIQLNNNKKSISVPVTNQDIGGFVVHYSFSAFNDFQSGTQAISVPHPKTELEIETLTFRDKLQLGQDETWRFKIKGPQGNKVSAELLASMYDASLDQFKFHNWNFNPIYKPIYYSYYRSNARQSFGTHRFRVYDFHPVFSYPLQLYDELNWFGFSFNNNYWTYKRYLNSLKINVKSTFDSKIKEGYVSGSIYDENGNPFPGVNVLVIGSTAGTTTDFDGNFSIKANKNDKLQISYIGYSTQEIKVGNNNHFNISLVEDNHSLEEVVVVGYGAQRKSTVVGAVTSVQAEAILEEEDASLPLSGKVTGIEVVKDSINSKNIKDTPDFNNVQIRKNLKETAFFFPQLHTDENGNVSFSFTTPEALTQWKLQLLAHTKTLESSMKALTTVTQKELMVIPNAPRFLRQGDQISISSKITNLTDKTLSGHATLLLFDALSGEPIDAKLKNITNNKTFSVTAKDNTQIAWQLTIPDNIQVVQYKVIAKSGNFSDGEQNILPVLTNRMLVTETLPMWIKSNEARTFTLDKLKTNTSSTLKHHKLTLEMTSNPAWHAVQALPYLMEYPYDCNEQTFSRYYANALASHIANSNPKIQDVFKQWATQDVLISNLEKNQELKQLLIQETPWLRDAQSETEQKKRIALLFDLNKMHNELESALRKLKNNQMASGAWPWFQGGRENRYITQHIITGYGHLLKLGVTSNANTMSEIIEKAINYLDAEFVREYKNIRKYNAKVDLTKDHLSYTQLHYLYMRSFFPKIKKSKEVREISKYYLSQIQNYWLSRSLYAKGLMALITNRMDDKLTASKILRSLKETSITSDELGMYWKENSSSWFWYQAPIETQALLIETFSEIENNTETIDNLKIWLLKNKQTNRWKTTKATTDAIYALLLQGSDWLNVTEMVDVTIGDQKIDPSKLESVKVEAGTGYYKTSWNTSEIKPNMGTVTLTKKGNGIAWGALYWQYFEDLDKISTAETQLKLNKELFLKTYTDKGESLTEITKETPLKIGDLITVRITLQNDRSMEFVHMKDMRASGLEPVNVLSQYKWQDGLGYYESTKDAATNFFFDYLPKGIFVFEYDLRVNNAGNMSNGITSIQSMYAPEFSSHSQGKRIIVNSLD
ncbi:carboxypeptidase-like regulatory domain-containing protein [Snuella lapsa]|uniref:Alpha-2-macroglobulin n=1 Tax=Snuella lapsa TaxID=870481 RepID=A0ABP6XF23_9FLAO